MKINIGDRLICRIGFKLLRRGATYTVKDIEIRPLGRGISNEVYLLDNGFRIYDHNVIDYMEVLPRDSVTENLKNKLEYISQTLNNLLNQKSDTNGAYIMRVKTEIKRLLEDIK